MVSEVPDFRVSKIEYCETFCSRYNFSVCVWFWFWSCFHFFLFKWKTVQKTLFHSNAGSLIQFSYKSYLFLSAFCTMSWPFFWEIHVIAILAETLNLLVYLMVVFSIIFSYSSFSCLFLRWEVTLGFLFTRLAVKYLSRLSWAVQISQFTMLFQWLD